MKDERINHLTRFYSLLDILEEKLGGARRLKECSGYLDWSERGVYFFCEDSELRNDSGHGPRIVRVGTHALKAGSQTSLWNRLSQHKGQANTGGGNHRGSIFRLLVGTALIQLRGYKCPTWGVGNSASRDIRESEIAVEREVSTVIGHMPFLWLAIEDEPGPASQRGYIERNSIALLSNYNKSPLDRPSLDWLGRYCNRELVRDSGLWNSMSVDDSYDPRFLDKLEELITAVRSAA
jgi:hypothetical protein